MSGIPYHAWTHRPKAQGGTDPLPDVNPWARRSKGFDASDQTISNNSITALTFNHDYNIATGESGEGWFDVPGGSTTALRLLVDGMYTVTAEVMWSASGTFTAGIGISDGVSGGAHWVLMPFSNFTQFSFTQSFTHRWTVNTSLQLQVFQNSGVSKDVDAAYMEVVYLDAYTGTDWTSMNPDQ